MKRIFAIAVTALVLTGTTGAFAAPFTHRAPAHQVETPRHETRAPERHNVWTKGKRVPLDQRRHFVDHKRAHLKAPGRGQQWVQVDNQYLLINIATGLISSVFASR